MKRIFIAVIMSLAFTTTVAQAVEQTAFSGAGVIESTNGGFKFPDGSVQITAPDNDLSARVAELEALVANLQSLLAGIYRLEDPNTEIDTLRFEGMNVQIVNGTGSTNGEPDGTGNLIIGYNEIRNEGLATVTCPSDVETEFNCNRRWGSHMLVIGILNNYSSYGGMVAGVRNETSDYYSSISGGYSNEASGKYSSVSGGYSNKASGNYSSVSGGQSNNAIGYSSSVSGGVLNEAIAYYSSVSGGHSSEASGIYSSVSGGWGNEARGEYSSVSGGRYNLASGDAASVSGGVSNWAQGEYSSVSGGEARWAASGQYDWVAGGLWQDR